MDTLKLVDAGLRAFDTRLPEVSPARCLVTRYHASSCRRCLDVCPGAAIACAEWLAVDPDRCTSCGACAAVCKTGALSLEGRSLALRDHLYTAVQHGQRHARISCRCCGPPEPSSGERAGDIGVQCLGGVSAADLIAAAAGGMKRVALRSGLCDACADAKAGGAVDAAIEAAEGVLSELGYEIAFERSCLDLPPRVGPASEHDLGVQTGGVSRRELFSFFARGLRRTVAESAAAPKRGVAELHAQSPPPGAHDRLVNDLMALAGQASSRPVTLPVDLSLGAVTIGDACNGCGLCVRYCPHGCFRPEDSSIVVEDERCTGCGLCVEVCPPEALSAKPEKVTG